MLSKPITLRSITYKSRKVVNTSWCESKTIDDCCQFTHCYIFTFLDKAMTSETGIIFIDIKHELTIISINNTRPPMNIINRIYLLSQRIISRISTAWSKSCRLFLFFVSSLQIIFQTISTCCRYHPLPRPRSRPLCHPLFFSLSLSLLFRTSFFFQR